MYESVSTYVSPTAKNWRLRQQSFTANKSFWRSSKIGVSRGFNQIVSTVLTDNKAQETSSRSYLSGQFQGILLVCSGTLRYYILRP